MANSKQHKSRYCVLVRSALLLMLTIGFITDVVAQSKNLTSMKVGAIHQGGDYVYFSFSDMIATTDVQIQYTNPKTIELTFKDTKPLATIPEIANTHITFEKMAVLPDQQDTKVILSLRQPINHKLSVTGKMIAFTMLPNTAVAVDQADEQTSIFSQYRNRIMDVEFHKAIQSGAELVISTSTSNIRMNVNKLGSDKMELRFADTKVSEAVEPFMHVVDLNTPIKRIDVTEQKNDAIITLHTKTDFRHIIRRYNNVVVLDIKPLPPETMAEFAKDAAAYKGKPISFDFQDIGVRSLLQIIADFTGLNIVVTDSVSGQMSLKLKNIPWDQALDIILSSQKLSEKRMGDVVFIAPTEELNNREMESSLSKISLADSAALYSEVFHLQYSKSDEIVKAIKDKEGTLLSSRGQVGMDARTNAVWVRDTAERLAEIRKVVKRLDVPTRQVSIEARVVSIETTMKEEIGVRLGVTRVDHNILAGSIEATDSLSAGTARSAISLTDRLNYDFAARAIDTLSPARVALGLIDLGNHKLLDLELSALEREGLTEIISRPHLITTNMRTARVEKGEDVPFEETTSSGATSIKFRKAVLSLEVTPQITPDERIILDIKVNDDQVGSRVFRGLPTIDTQNVSTQVLLNDGETIVLGGIYQNNNVKEDDGVPYLRKVPLLGRLFSHKNDLSEKTELLIFVTPKLITHASYIK